MKTRKGYLFQKKTGGTWYVRTVVNGKAIVKSTGTTIKREAEKRRAEIMAPFVAGDDVAVLKAIAARIQDKDTEVERIKNEANPPLSVADAWLTYCKAGNRKQSSDSTMATNESRWKTFERWMTDAHPEVKTLRDVSFEVCEDFRGHLIGQGSTGRTVNAYRSFLRAFWNVLGDRAKFEAVFTLSDGRVTHNPWAKLAKRDEHSKGRRPLTVDELKSVCGAATGELRIMLALGLYLGARLGDCASMDWGNVDMVRRVVRFVPRKTARKKPDALVIPMHPELFAILSEIPQNRRTGPVCPEMAERYERRGADGVSDVVQRHFEKCGLTTTGARNGEGIRRVVEVGFHSMRHSAVSLLREAGAAQSISQAIVGHNSGEVHALYTHTDETAMRRAVDSLPSITGNGKAAEAPAAPALLPGGNDKGLGVEAVLARVKAIAEGMTARTWKTDRKALLEICG